MATWFRLEAVLLRAAPDAAGEQVRIACAGGARVFALFSCGADLRGEQQRFVQGLEQHVFKHRSHGTGLDRHLDFPAIAVDRQGLAFLGRDNQGAGGIGQQAPASGL
ncbi:hypothetical protein M1B34_01985 [Pseudomonas sp. MAFF 302030]|uniref:Uncharacterized protein n=1 Tax=Pseudomonas morbosilactucae TaxID=2938197 RepID=A0A9X1YQG6_9PSED|nr:hypothetical protein [Pseudomonas morbosilactucae]MCK9796545.1 hypothetical protein [Pseudomonas morbosilactucae]